MNASSALESDIASRAKHVLNKAAVCDLTLPWEENVPSQAKRGAWERFARAGFSFVSLTVADDINWVRDTVPYIQSVVSEIERASDRYVLVRRAEDIVNAKAQGRLGLGLHFQGTNPFQGRLEMVESYYTLGVRHALLAYNQRNLVGDGCHERTDGGLSRFGITLIAEMNRVGMLVDCSHSGYRTTMEAMEVSTAPCIFSHSLARALVDHERNISDEQIIALAKTGGVIGVNGIGFFMSNDLQASTEALVRHIDHIAQLVGPQHIALGLDFVLDDHQMQLFYSSNKDLMYPSGYPPPPWNYWPPERVEELTSALLRAGYSDEHVLGILGENFLRVARAVWR
ncbi:MAG TPA: membrane dipeptidase [Candidatus Baltobacteraceae bacterium]|jgi:membrane dipeptidase|nr:membrane dipeptidase [Candidatus Baltobacteraceae bacterium]